MTLLMPLSAGVRGPLAVASRKPFSPLDVPGVQFYGEAAFLTGLNDGDAVTTFTDFGPNGWHPTQATGTKKPTYRANQAKGQPVLRFDGVDDEYLFPVAALGMARNVAEFAIWLVCKPNSLPNAAKFPIIVCTAAAQSTRVALIHENSGAAKLDGGGRRVDGTAFQGVGGGVLSTSAYSVEAVTVDFQNRALRVYQNGTQVNSKLDFQTAGNTSDTNSNSIAIGSASNVQWAAMDLAAVLLLNQVPSASDRAALEEYFQGKFV